MGYDLKHEKAKLVAIQQLAELDAEIDESESVE